MSSDAGEATTLEKKIEDAKDCVKWIKQKFLQHLLAGASTRFLNNALKILAATNDVQQMLDYTWTLNPKP